MNPGTGNGGDAEPVCEDNPYEQKLYSLFCGHDKEQRGWLTVNALQQLCKTLELKENGTKLTAALTERCGGGGPVGTADVRVTFKAFKEELLLVLGTEVCESPSAMAARNAAPSAAVEQQTAERGSLVVTVVDPGGTGEPIGSIVEGVGEGEDDGGGGGGVGGQAGNSIVSGADNYNNNFAAIRHRDNRLRGRFQ